VSRSALIWGLGRLGGGIGAALHLHRRGYRLTVMDRAPADSLSETIARLSADLPELEVRPESADSIPDVDLVCVNQAIPPLHPLLAELRSRGLEITQELDLFLRHYPGDVIAVTGTNGKSTTATLTARVLATGDRSVLLGGNIGHSLLLDEDEWRRDQWAVVEVSSFQAARLDLSATRFRHAVLTPIGIDHVGWHGSIERYQHDKLRRLDAVDADGRIVGTARCGALAEAAARRGRELEVIDTEPKEGGRGHVPYLDRGGRVRSDERELFARNRLQLPGNFNLENALLALGLGLGPGFEIEPDAAVRSILDFGGLPHRLQALPPQDGISFVDNGVSTVAETTLSAITALAPRGPIRWIGGGRAKSDDLGEYLTAVAPRVESVHLFGEIAGRLGALLGDQGIRATVDEPMTGALERARAAARPGDVLLFSPGFSSFDQFPNFAVRAQHALRWWHDCRTRARDC